MERVSSGGELVFDVSLHPRPGGAVPGEDLFDSNAAWPTLVMPRESAGETMAIGFDKALERLAALERLYVEPDGSFVWVGPGSERGWQVDGNAYERNGRVLVVEVKGRCPPAAWECLLAVWGWPEEALLVQLVRAGGFVDEPTFRSMARLRGAIREA